MAINSIDYDEVFKPIYSTWYAHKLWQACQALNKRMIKRKKASFTITFTYPLYDGLIVHIKENGRPNSRVIETFSLQDAIIELEKKINNHP